MKQNLQLKELQTNKLYFENLLNQIEQQTDWATKNTLAKQAINFVLATGTGYYSSDIIEKVYTDLAQTIKSPLSKTYKKDACLMVMTETYETGGHTRVVERWVEIDENKKYSLIFTSNQKQKIPQRLIDAVYKSGGNIICLKDNLSDTEKAIELRKIASKFEFIVLHIHMHDIVPLIAFGTKEFERPVIFYNHADHRFWLGLSIADEVVNFRLWGQCIASKSRGVETSFILPIPFNQLQKKLTPIQDIRKKLNISNNKKIILTIGTYPKYLPILNMNFGMVVNKILKLQENITIIAIGPIYKKFPEWKKIKHQNNMRFILCGRIPFEEIASYYHAADLVLDSYPLRGDTVLTDAVCYKKPVLTLNNDIDGMMDWIINSPAVCQTEDELIDKTIKLLNDEKLASDQNSALLNEINKMNDIVSFRTKLSQLYTLTPKAHTLHEFSPPFHSFSDLDYYHLISSKHTKIIFSLGVLLSVYKEKNAVYQNLKISVLGHSFILYKRANCCV